MRFFQAFIIGTNELKKCNVLFCRQIILSGNFHGLKAGSNSRNFS